MRKFILPLILTAAAFAQTSSFPAALDTDSSLFVTADFVQSTLAVAMTTGSTTATVADGSRFAENMVITVCDTAVSSGVMAGKCTAWEHMKVTAVNTNVLTVTRGFAGTTARVHAAGKAVSVAPKSVEREVLADAVKKIETALGANLANAQGAGGKPAASYDFTPQAPGGALIAGGVGQAVTLTPCPAGVNGTDARHYLYLSGGTGTAEAALITGGTCTSGATTGTVTFTPANAHSGAWTVRSASGGIKEASIANNGQGAILLPSGDINIRGILVLPTTQSLIGQGAATTAAAGTNSTLICSTAASPCEVIADGAGTAAYQGVGVHRDYSLLGPGSGYGLWIGGDPASVFAPSAWTGSFTRFENLNVTGFAEAVYHRKGNFVDYSGVALTGSTTAFHIASDCGGEIQPINFYNSLISVPSGGTAAIDMDCSGTLSGPVTVFGGQVAGTVVGDSVDLEFFGVHFEANENLIPILNITNNQQHLVRIHGGILAFHGANATTLTSGIIMSGAGLYSLIIEGAWIQADTGYTVTNLVEFNPSLGGDLTIRQNSFALAGTFTNMLSATLSTMQGARILIEQPVAPSVATGITAGSTVTFPAGNYPVMQPQRIYGGTVGGGITAVAGLRAYSSGTLSTSSAQTFTAGATIGNTITTTAGLPYSFYYDGTKLWVK